MLQNKITRETLPPSNPTVLVTHTSTEGICSLSHDRLCHPAIPLGSSHLLSITSICPDIKFVEVCRFSVTLGPINRTLVSLKRARGSPEKQKQALSLYSCEKKKKKKLFYIIISFSLLYLALFHIFMLSLI